VEEDAFDELLDGRQPIEHALEDVR